MRASHFLITTEKDIVKRRRITDSRRILYLGIDVDFVKGEKEMRELLSQCAFPDIAE